MAAELRFEAMGSAIHVVVVGGGECVAAHAPRRFADLEARWSRFRPESEISRLNRAAGAFVAVSGETVDLVRRALEGWRRTGGLFDPTMLGALLRAGYDRPFAEITRLPPAARPKSQLDSGCAAIAIEGGCVQLPADVGFDPGGIGKGLAADLICAELLELGASGALVNAGGDVRVAGEGPMGAGWTVAIAHPHRAAPIALLGLAEGAVATSTTLLRRWQVEGVSEHHLIDPATDRPAAETIELASAVAAEGWLAEIWAKALLLRPRSGLRALERDGLSGLVIDRNGRFEASGGLAAYLGASLLGVTPMASVSREHEAAAWGRRDGQAAIELDESVSTRIALVQPPRQAPRP